MPREKIRILVFPGGSEIGLEIHRALKYCKDILLFSANSGASNHSPFVYKNNFIIPDVSSKTWIRELNNVVKNNNIDFIFPAHDEVLAALSENRDKIFAKIIIPSRQTCAIACSKRLTYERLKRIVPTPEIITDIHKANLPVFMKPDRGQGSRNAVIINSQSALNYYKGVENDMITLKYLPGREYTVDCFSDLEHKPLFYGARERIRTKNGISMNSKIVNDTIFKKYAADISEAMQMEGAWFFQMKEDDHGIKKLLEVAPRISGTMSVFRTLGVNFPLLSIYQKVGIKIEIMANDCQVEVDRALASRYKHNIVYKNIYIDFDDTIILNKKINTDLMKFIYQSRNNKKNIYLLTKSENDVRKALYNNGISENLFKEIIQIRKNDNKIDYLKKTDSIFIDDSFSERKRVNSINIPTFDLSMLELLIEDHEL